MWVDSDENILIEKAELAELLKYSSCSVMDSLLAYLAIKPIPDPHPSVVEEMNIEYLLSLCSFF